MTMPEHAQPEAARSDAALTGSAPAGSALTDAALADSAPTDAARSDAAPADPALTDLAAADSAPADAGLSDTAPALARTAVVLISSTRAAAGVYADKTGPILVEWLRGKGFRVGEPVVRADGEEFAVALGGALGASPALVITSGGTGISPTDVTPQITAGLLDYRIPGLADALRRYGADKGVPTAVLSRGLVGVAGRTLVVNLPGSSGGVRDGMAVLDGVLDHALDQLAGGDHARPDAGGDHVRPDGGGDHVRPDAGGHGAGGHDSAQPHGGQRERVAPHGHGSHAHDSRVEHHAEGGRR